MTAEALDVPVRGEMIRLGQLLKVAGVVDAGGEVKDRRGRRLRAGDEVQVGEERLRLVGTPAIRS